MNQKLSNFAGIASIVASLAVVVTVIVLVAEIRQSTNATRASMYASTTSDLIGNRMLRIQDPEFNELWTRFARRPDSGFSEAERTRLFPHLQTLFQVYDSAFVTRQYDLLGDSEWSRFEAQACQNYERVHSAMMPVDGLAGVVSEDFWVFLETTCR